MPAKQVDPITLEVIELSFVNVVREMRATLIRTSYSSVLYEAHDFSCALLDPKGQLIGLSHDNPRHIFPALTQCEILLEKFKDIAPGDVFAANDPYTGGTHLNDVAIFYPFFFEGKLSAVVGVRAHFTDVGGSVPGSLSGQATDTHQEGIRIPPVRICRRGEMDSNLMEVIFANMRLAKEREGDFLSMLDTCRTAEKRLQEICAKYGAGTLESGIEALLDRAERYMRQIISRSPKGVWYYEHYLESSGATAEPVPLRCKMEIKGDTVTFDLTGTAPQVRGPVNAGLAMGATAAFMAVKSLLNPLSPINSGSFRPIKLINPEGTVINARYPAACGGFSEVTRNVFFLIAGLIAQAMPEVATGAMKCGANHTMIGAWDPVKKKDFIFYEYPQGGWAASPGTDGSHCVPGFDSADISSFHSTESIENEQGIRVVSMEMRPDSEGAGKNRGGLGMVRKIEVLGERALLSIVGENAVIPPYGVSDGCPGAGMVLDVVRKDGSTVDWPIPGKVTGFPMEYGDLLVMRSVGGGGCGDPLDREAEKVRQDVLDDYVTEARAREVYGVILRDGEVDMAATDRLRKHLRKSRVQLKITASRKDDFNASGCRLCRMSRVLARRLKVATGDIIEYVAHEGPPLRAWVKVDASLTGKESPLGPRGRAMLKVGKGDPVQVRALGATKPASV